MQKVTIEIDASIPDVVMICVGDKRMQCYDGLEYLTSNMNPNNALAGIAVTHLIDVVASMLGYDKDGTAVLH